MEINLKEIRLPVPYQKISLRDYPLPVPSFIDDSVTLEALRVINESDTRKPKIIAARSHEINAITITNTFNILEAIIIAGQGIEVSAILITNQSEAKAPEIESLQAINIAQLLISNLTDIKAPIIEIGGQVVLNGLVITNTSEIKAPAIETATAAEVSALIITNSTTAIAPEVGATQTVDLSAILITNQSEAKAPAIDVDQALELIALLITNTGEAKTPVIETATATEVSAILITNQSEAKAPAIDVDQALELIALLITNTSEAKEPVVDLGTQLELTALVITNASVSIAPLVETDEAAEVSVIIQNTGIPLAPLVETGQSFEFSANVIGVGTLFYWPVIEAEQAQPWTPSLINGMHVFKPAGAVKTGATVTSIPSEAGGYSLTAYGDPQASTDGTVGEIISIDETDDYFDGTVSTPAATDDIYMGIFFKDNGSTVNGAPIIGVGSPTNNLLVRRNLGSDLARITVEFGDIIENLGDTSGVFENTWRLLTLRGYKISDDVADNGFVEMKINGQIVKSEYYNHNDVYNFLTFVIGERVENPGLVLAKIDFGISFVCFEPITDDDSDRMDYYALNEMNSAGLIVAGHPYENGIPAVDPLTEVIAPVIANTSEPKAPDVVIEVAGTYNTYAKLTAADIDAGGYNVYGKLLAADIDAGGYDRYTVFEPLTFDASIPLDIDTQIITNISAAKAPVVTAGGAKPNLPTGFWEDTTYFSNGNTVVGARYFIPPNYNDDGRRRAFILDLHGNGAKKKSTSQPLADLDNEAGSWHKRIAQGWVQNDFIIVSPQISSGGWSTSILDVLYDKIINWEYWTEPNEAYLAGISLGGIGGLAQLQDRPGRWAAALFAAGKIPQSGYLGYQDQPIYFAFSQGDNIVKPYESLPQLKQTNEGTYNSNPPIKPQIIFDNKPGKHTNTQWTAVFTDQPSHLWFKNYKLGVNKTIRPYIESARIDINNQLIIVFSEAVFIDNLAGLSTPGKTYTSFNRVVYTYNSIDYENLREVKITISGSFTAGQAYTVSYNPASGTIRDTTNNENELISITNFPVTNNL